MATQSEKAPGRTDAPTFQDVIMSLQRYWADVGCVILQPYEIGRAHV